MMCYKLRYKISQVNGKLPNVNIPKIMSGISKIKWSLFKKKNCIYLDVVLKKQQLIFELKRRLSSKRNRRDTVVEIVSEEKIEGLR